MYSAGSAAENHIGQLIPKYALSAKTALPGLADILILSAGISRLFVYRLVIYRLLVCRLLICRLFVILLFVLFLNSRGLCLCLRGCRLSCSTLGFLFLCLLCSRGLCLLLCFQCKGSFLCADFFSRISTLIFYKSNFIFKPQLCLFYIIQPKTSNLYSMPILISQTEIIG